MRRLVIWVIALGAALSPGTPLVAQQKEAAVRGYVGVVTLDINDALAKQEGFTNAKDMGERLGLGGKTEGAYAAAVTPGSPAFKAGLQHGDVIVEYRGKPVKGRADLGVLIGGSSPGVTVPIKVMRGGKAVDFNVIVAEVPADMEALGRAYKLHQKGDIEGAIAAYREAIRLNPDSVAGHLGLARALYGKGDLVGAGGECRQAIRAKPDDAASWTSLGGMLGQLRDFDGAYAAYKEAVRLKPDDATAHLGLAGAFTMKGELTGAIAEYKEAIRLQPENDQAHLNLAFVLDKKEDLEGAIAERREAIRINPARSDTHVLLGGDLFLRGDLDGAISEYKEGIRLKPDDASAHLGLGLALRKKKDTTGAIAEFKEAARLDPNNAEACAWLGMALQEKGDVDGALAAYNDAIHRKVDFSMPYYGMAVIAAKAGEADLAVDCLRTALKYDRSVREDAAQDKDFDRIRDTPEFKQLIGK